MSLALTRNWNYDNKMHFGLGVMDLRMASTNADLEENLRDRAFFMYIQRMQGMTRQNFSKASVWL